MNKKELISAVERDADITIEQSTKVVYAIFDTKKTAPRNGRNPKTGEPVYILTSKSGTFKTGNYFKEAVK